jgi:hypothetical protein
MASQPLVVQLTTRTVYTVASVFTAVAGLTFSGAAFAAGITSVDLLAMLFLMGSAGALLALIVFYLLQPRTQP